MIETAFNVSMPSTAFLVLFGTALVLIYSQWRAKASSRALRRLADALPGPRNKDGSVLQYCTRPELPNFPLGQTVTDLAQEYGPYWIAINYSGMKGIHCNEIETIMQIYQDDKTFVRSWTTRRFFELFVANGLMTTAGHHHAMLQKVSKRALNPSSLQGLKPSFQPMSRNLVNYLEQEIAQGKSSTRDEHGFSLVDVGLTMPHAVLDLVGRIIYNHEFNLLNGGKDRLHLVMRQKLTMSGSSSLYAKLRFISPTIEKIGRLLRVKEQLELDSLNKETYVLANSLISEAKQLIQSEKQGKDVKRSDFEAKDLLTLLVRSNMATDLKPEERITDQEIVGLAADFYLASQDTTPTVLQWLLDLLSSSERGLEVQSRLRAELNDLSNDGWQDFPERMEALPYLDAVVHEALRFQAPTKVNLRTATRDTLLPVAKPTKDRFGKPITHVPIPKGYLVVLCSGAYEMDKSKWGPTAREFWPERWLPASHEHAMKAGTFINPRSLPASDRDHLATFASGAYSCIGHKLAITIIKSFSANLVVSFEIAKVPGVIYEGVGIPVSHPRARNHEMLFPIKLKPIS